MAKLTKSFDEFLSEIEPSKKAVKYASKAHTRIREHLEEDEEFKEIFEGSFLYGSYKRNTAVGDIKDVDIVLLTNFDPDDEENTPQHVLRKVKEALNRYYEASDNQQYQRRSIRVDDPLPDEKDAKLTLDVIPAFAPYGDDEALLVPDRELKKWVPSHPKGHIENATTLNDENHGNGMYIPLVKMMKHWWKYQCEMRQPDTERPKPKGFWVECLAGENFDQNQEDYASHFIKVLENIFNKYSEAVSVPELNDPGLPEKKIMTSMTVKEFEIFMGAVNECLALAREAYDEEDEEKSSEIWQKIFGEEFFPQASGGAEKKSIAFPSGFSLGDYSHKQELYEIGIKDPGKNILPINIRAGLYFGKWDAKEMNRRFQRLFSSGSMLPHYHWLKYEVIGDIDNSHNIYWQVVNTGAHAEFKGVLRGKIDIGECAQWERSEYTGVHWIECFIVDPSIDTCIGRSGPFYVVFNNPEFPNT